MEICPRAYWCLYFFLISRVDVYLRIGSLLEGDGERICKFREIESLVNHPSSVLNSLHTE